LVLLTGSVLYTPFGAPDPFVNAGGYGGAQEF
jgi:hypothetical protein